MKAIVGKCNCGSLESLKSKCPIINMPFFAGVPETVWEGFREKRIANNYHKGNVIFYEGNRPFGVYFLCAGRVKIIRTDTGLHSSIPRVVEAPDLLGDRAFLAGEAYLGTGEALEDCRICFLEGTYFEKYFLESPEVSRALVRRLAAKLGQAEEHLLDFGFKTVRGRLAKYIVEKTSDKGSSVVEFPESRGDLAKILGTSPEVLCRLLSEFRKKGWISVSGPDVTVKDKARLEQVSRR
ncbi:MAG: Crp/Fnr family transcriptional regulator [Elusimicrobiales bacterium]|nr:Crp/Fnr family transcriptional regulator [Elusimicrobiales bacterium]